MSVCLDVFTFLELFIYDFLFTLRAISSFWWFYRSIVFVKIKIGGSRVKWSIIVSLSFMMLFFLKFFLYVLFYNFFVRRIGFFSVSFLSLTYTYKSKRDAIILLSNVFINSHFFLTFLYMYIPSRESIFSFV